MDGALHPLIAFSAGFPGGIQLSQLPILPICVTQWRHPVPMDGQGDRNLKSHDVYELVPRVSGSNSAGYSSRSSRTPFLTSPWPDSLLEAITSVLALTMVNHFCL